MANKLLEKYSKKIQLAEAVYSKRHNGEQMDNMRKITVAKCLDNVNAFLNEAFDSSIGTQRSAMGDYKKFCIALTTVGLPNLIAFDLVAVSPMSSMTGNIAYVEYIKGVNKGESKEGDLVNGIWELGKPDANYTGDRVVENVTAAGDFVPAWNPVVGNKVIFVAEDGTETEIEAVDGKYAIPAAGRVKYVYDNVIVPAEALPTLKAQLKNIGLEAKARRIAVFYSQIAAFQA